MAAAADLRDAARRAWEYLSDDWSDGSLVVDARLFAIDIQVIFPDDGSVANRTVTNWLMPLWRARQNYNSYSGSIEYVGDIIDSVSRLCWAAWMAMDPPPAPGNASFTRITAAQAAAILAAYNARF